MSEQIKELNEKYREQRDAAVFEQRMEQFWKRWAPDDKYEAAQFHAELTSIVRQVISEAQEPAFRHVEALMRSLPLPSTIFPKE